MLGACDLEDGMPFLRAVPESQLKLRALAELLIFPDQPVYP